MRTGALAAGAALTTALAAVAGIAMKTASEIQQLDLQMQFSDEGIQYVYNQGHALERLGGQASDATKEYLALQKVIDDLQVKGEGAAIYEDLAIIGIDPSSLLNVRNVVEFQEKFADIISVSSDRVKRQAQEILGLSDASMRMYERGSTGMREMMADSEKLTGNIETMRDGAIEAREEWEKTKQTYTGVMNTISEKSIESGFLKGLAKAPVEAPKSLYNALPEFVRNWIESKPDDDNEEVIREQQINNNYNNQYQQKWEVPKIGEPTELIIIDDILTVPNVTNIQNNNTSTFNQVS